MAYQFSRRFRLVLAILMLTLVLSACGGNPAPTQAAGASPAPTQGQTQAADSTSTLRTENSPVPVQTPTANLTPAAVTGNVIFGSGAYNLPKTTAGLSDLTGYKATLTLSFDGTQAGQANKWLRTYVMLTNKQPAARQLTVEQTGDVSDPAHLFMAEADGAVFERSGDNPCTADVIDPSYPLTQQFEPAGFLSVVVGADVAGSETVNGIAADHIKFDERALGQAGISKSTGELWVASSGGYIVRYLLTTKAGADYFGDNSEGTLIWDYELTAVNQPLTLDVPKDCPAGMVDAPLLPDASNITSLPGVISFDASTSLTDAAAFYQKQIPTLGWKAAGEPAVSDGSLLLDFTKAEKTLTISITSDSGVTTVTILLAR